MSIKKPPPPAFLRFLLAPGPLLLRAALAALERLENVEEKKKQENPCDMRSMDAKGMNVR